MPGRGRVTAVREAGVQSHRALSPLTAYGLGGGFEDWCTWNTWFISRCEELWVLMLDGWKESTGVTAETAIARALGKPTYYVEPSDWGAIHGIEITETS